MNDCYLNFLVSFRALFSLDVGANLVNSKQTIGIILPDLSLLGYAVPVESFGIGLFVILFTYLIIEYNVQLLSHEKFKIAMNMLHTAHTPLILLRNQLEELKTGNLPEPLSQQVEEALGYAECIIYCNRNIATLNKVNKRIPPKTSTVNLELSTYVTSIVNQCRAHANSRQIQKDRFKVLKHGDFWYSETPDIPSYGWGARCRRICTWGYFKDLRSGKKFYVFNSHTDHEATEARRQSSFMLLEQVRKIAKGRPTFCTGDFNATPDEEPVQLLLKDSLLLDSYKCTLTPPKGPSGSFYAYDKTGKTAKRIDFIFVTPKIKILSYHTIDDDIKYNKYSSDHFPVMVEALLK